MKFIELFAGIGGFRYGLEETNRIQGDRSSRSLYGRSEKGLHRRIQKSTPKEPWGFDCVWSNEYDKYASQIYKKHYGECDTRDIRTVKASEIPSHDLICGGFPCQSFSIAGKRQGFSDTRGTLFYEILRIARFHRTPYLFLENVKGLLNHDQGQTFSVILESLDELGYDCQWQVLNSKNFGVPQNRERVFIIGHLRGQSRPEVFPIGESNQVPNEESDRKTQTTHPIRAGYKAGQGGNDYIAHNTGNYLKEMTKNQSQGARVYKSSGISQTISSGGGGMGAKTGLYAVGGLQENAAKMKDQSPALTEAMGKGGGHTPIIVPEDMKIRRLTPVECARLQGFPDDWCADLSDTQAYKCLGNAVTTNVISAIGKKLRSL